MNCRWVCECCRRRASRPLNARASCPSSSPRSDARDRSMPAGASAARVPPSRVIGRRPSEASHQPPRRASNSTMGIADQHGLLRLALFAQDVGERRGDEQHDSVPSAPPSARCGRATCHRRRQSSTRVTFGAGLDRRGQRQAAPARRERRGRRRRESRSARSERRHGPLHFLRRPPSGWRISASSSRSTFASVADRPSSSRSTRRRPIRPCCQRTMAPNSADTTSSASEYQNVSRGRSDSGSDGSALARSADSLHPAACGSSDSAPARSIFRRSRWT